MSNNLWLVLEISPSFFLGKQRRQIFHSYPNQTLNGTLEGYCFSHGRTTCKKFPHIPMLWISRQFIYFTPAGIIIIGKNKSDEIVNSCECVRILQCSHCVHVGEIVRLFFFFENLVFKRWCLWSCYRRNYPFEQTTLAKNLQIFFLVESTKKHNKFGWSCAVSLATTRIAMLFPNDIIFCFAFNRTVGTFSLKENRDGWFPYTWPLPDCYDHWDRKRESDRCYYDRCRVVSA